MTVIRFAMAESACTSCPRKILG